MNKFLNSKSQISISNRLIALSTLFFLSGTTIAEKVGNNNEQLAGGEVKQEAKNSTAIGGDSIVKNGNNNVAIGWKSLIEAENDPKTGKEKKTTHNNFALGAKSKIKNGSNNFATGFESSIDLSEDSFAIGKKAKILSAKRSYALGTESLVEGGENNFAIGYRAKVLKSDNKVFNNSFALGTGATVSGERSFALGSNAHVSGSNSVAVSGRVKGMANSVAIGGRVLSDGSKTLQNNSTSVGFGATTFGWSANAIGYGVNAFREASAQGYRNYAFGRFSSAIGSNNITVEVGSSAIGYMNKALEKRAVAIGASNFAGRGEFLGEEDAPSGYYYEHWTTSQSTKKFKWLDAISSSHKKLYDSTENKQNWLVSNLYLWMGGTGNKGVKPYIEDNKYIFKGLTDSHEITLGGEDAEKVLTLKLSKAFTDALSEEFIAKGQTAMGSQNVATGNRASAMGFGNVAIGNDSAAIGFGSMALATNSLAYGNKTIVEGKNSAAFGLQNYVATQNSMAAGTRNLLLEGAENTFVLGSNVETTLSNSVFLGANSKSVGYAAVEVPAGYKWAGVQVAASDRATSPIGVVAIGSGGYERQIQHVAAGRINEDSTDAVNGSQLYWLKQSIDDQISKLKPGVELVDHNGNVAPPDAEGKIKIDGGASDSTINNIKTEVEGNSIAVRLAKNVKGLESLGVTDDKGNGTVITRNGIYTKFSEKDKEGNDITKEVPMGTKFKGDEGGEVEIPLNHTLSLNGGSKAKDLSSEANVGVVKGGENSLNIRLAKNLKGIESIDGLKELTYDEMQSDANNNKAVSVASMKSYLENYASNGQLKESQNKLRKDLEGKINTTRKDALAGAAMAMAVANLPQATTPGEKTVSVAAGIVDSHAAYAIGISSISDSGKWKLRGSLTGSDQGQVGGGIGAGYSWK